MPHASRLCTKLDHLPQRDAGLRERSVVLDLRGEVLGNPKEHRRFCWDKMEADIENLVVRTLKAGGAHDRSYHELSDREVDSIRTRMLQWFDANKRGLPWRKPIPLDPEQRAQRAYEVWVSEVMLQQTQVVTVIPYYDEWMKRWPTVHDLGQADIEEVHRVWAGLGYYSRAKRMHECAKKLVAEYDGRLPKTPTELLKLPGIGPYTAGAVASIAYDLEAPLVDGNVSRVLARLLALGGDMKRKSMVDFIWSCADRLVKGTRPGHFNESLMDLGATLCTPKAPNCKSCPIQTFCRGLMEQRHGDVYIDLSHDTDVEIECEFCEPWSAGHFDAIPYPCASKKTKQRNSDALVVIVENDLGEVLMIKRQSGLLGGLWHFPLTDDVTLKDSRDVVASTLFQIGYTLQDSSEPIWCGKVRHIFSHIKQMYHVYHVYHNHLSGKPSVNVQWASTMDDVAVSTAMKKVFSVYLKNFRKGRKRKFN